MSLKRIMDITLSLFSLIVFAPVFILITLLVVINLGRPVLFIQSRPGLNTKAFKLIKFRSMQESSNKQLSDAQRLNKFGKWLRSYSLDELPQLWNVLIGDMSLVGPRPQLTEYLPIYTKEQLRRHLVKPGITGWSQINGRNNIPWDEKLQLDLWYVDNHSLLLDIKIILKTFVKVISRQNITSEGHATSEPFKK